MIFLLYLVIFGALLAYESLRFFQALAIPDIGDGIAPSEWGPSWPLVSFLVAGWNAEDDIKEFIESYRALTYPNRQLVLCVGGSDSSLQLARQYESPEVVIIQQNAGDGKQVALRRAFTKAEGGIFYLTDIDCRPSDATIRNTLGIVISGQTQVATSGSVPAYNQFRIPLVRARAAVDLATAPRQMYETSGLLGRNTVVSRGALEAIGGFPIPAPSGTDYVLAQELRNAGFRIIHVPGAPMVTKYQETMLGYIRQQRRWIRNVYVLGRKYRVRSDIRGSTLSLILPYGLLMLLIVGVGWPEGFAVFTGIIVHSIITRLRYQRLARVRLTLFGAVQCFLSEQSAALLAFVDVILDRVIW